MITEDYVSFETSRLLKEKGFDSECDYLYVNGNIVRARGYKCNWNKGETMFTDYKNECSAPTLQMAMKWLREIYKIGIDITSHWNLTPEYHICEYRYRLHYNNAPNHDINQKFKTYEEACEAAIKYCLENLI